MQRTEKSAILETEALTRRYGTLIAVDAMTISVGAGEVFGLLGPNGAGKSTAIKMLTTLLPPTSGRAHVAGFDIVRQAAQVRSVIGYVPQALSADGTLTGYENLLVFAKLYDVPRREQTRRVREALAFMGLEDLMNWLVGTYSGGMIRRLEIALATLHRPRMLFLDEPTIGLDPLARETVWEHLQQLRAETGVTIFLTTHYMDEAERFCTHVAIMHLGKVAAYGTPAELIAAIGGDEVTLDDVFVHYAGGTLDSGGSYRETARARRAIQRIG